MNFIRRHLTYANVISTLALLISLSGSAYAFLIITGANVKDGSLTGRDIHASTLSGNHIKDGTLQSRDIQDHTIGAIDLRQNAAFPYSSTVPHGLTLRGAWHLGRRDSTTYTGDTGTAISFVFSFTSPLEINYLRRDDLPTQACPGTYQDPKAIAGNFCMYERYRHAISHLRIFSPANGYNDGVDFAFPDNTRTGDGKTAVFGADIIVWCDGTDSVCEDKGSWAAQGI